MDWKGMWVTVPYKIYESNTSIGTALKIAIKYTKHTRSRRSTKTSS